MRERLLNIQARLEKRGADAEAERVARSVSLLDRFMGRHAREDEPEEAQDVRASKRRGKQRRIKSKVAQRQMRRAAPPEIPADCKKYYEDCKKDPPETAKGRVDEYCSRVAWQICCQAGKGGKHCTELGLTKKKGPIED